MATPDTDASRYERERAFHDERFEDDDRPANRFYAIFEAPKQAFIERLDRVPADAVALDYGCGATASSARRLARRGVKVTAIDLSPVAIDVARETAEREGVADRIDFRVMNAEQLEIDDDSLDFVCGTGVLHHMDLHTAYAELARVMRPDARAAFSEPLGYNPAINLYRRLTPAQRTPDEHPFVRADIELARTYFHEVGAEYFSLLSLAALPVRRLRESESVVARLDAADRALFGRFPRLGPLGWTALVEFGRPR